MTDRALRRKLTFRAHGATLVLIKRPEESTEHILQKALLWALYIPTYPSVRVEVPLPGPSRYKPDLLDMADQRPRFWGECGVVAQSKLHDLLRRYRTTHFVFSKWAMAVEPFAAMIDDGLHSLRRSAPVELLRFPKEIVDRISDEGEIELTFRDVEVRRWE